MTLGPQHCTMLPGSLGTAGCRAVPSSPGCCYGQGQARCSRCHSCFFGTLCCPWGTPWPHIPSSLLGAGETHPGIVRVEAAAVLQKVWPHSSGWHFCRRNLTMKLVPAGYPARHPAPRLLSGRTKNLPANSSSWYFLSDHSLM